MTKVEVLETTLPYRTRSIHRSADVDPFLFSDVCHRSEVTRIEVDNK